MLISQAIHRATQNGKKFFSQPMTPRSPGGIQLSQLRVKHAVKEPVNTGVNPTLPQLSALVSTYMRRGSTAGMPNKIPPPSNLNQNGPAHVRVAYKKE